MGKQSYSNHLRYHPIYHFALLPLALVFFGISIFLFIQKAVQSGLWAEGTFYLLAGFIVVLVVILLRSIPLKLQDRIIRTEVKLRYLATTGKHLNGLEKNLRTSQMMALRFASDDELPRLIEQTMQEDLTPADIKKRIKRWRGDYHRI